MSESLSDGQEGVESDTDDIEGDDAGSDLKSCVEVEVGNLSISVEAPESADENAEEQFYRIYQFLMEDVEDWSRALDAVITREGGYQ